MIETTLVYEDFKKRIDRDKPIHYYTQSEPLNKYQMEWNVSLVLSGIERENGWVMRFIATEEVEMKDRSKKEEIENTLFQELILRYAKPLNATLGYYETEEAK